MKSPQAFCRTRGRLHCGEEQIEIKSERRGNHKLNTVRGIGATPDVMGNGNPVQILYKLVQPRTIGIGFEYAL